MVFMKQERKNITDKYEDIIDLPHYVSKTRPQMKIIDRAAQFSPFAALTGYDAAIKETGRLTDPFIELDENRKADLDHKLQFILEHIKEQPEVTITYFQPDEKKNGGKYITITESIKKIDEYEQCIKMREGTKILLKYVFEIIIAR